MAPIHILTAILYTNVTSPLPSGPRALACAGHVT